MAGLAASIALPTSTAESLAQALAPRGSDAVLSRTGDVILVVRAAMPRVYEVDGCWIVVDGMAQTSPLMEAYRSQGPAGLLAGAEPYALILTDPAHEGLLLARNGDGPSLYYARTGGGMVVASEPEALLAAGVPARPYHPVIDAFLSAGACDDTAETFFAGIRRVRPNEVVAVRGSGTVHTWAGRAAAHPVSPRVALRAAVSGTIGVRLGSGPVGAAILGTALVRPELPVYSNRWPDLPGRGEEHTWALLSPLPEGAVRHHALPFFPDCLDISAFLDDVGQPLPDLDSYLLWATARESVGEVDALLDAAAPAPHLARLADRIGSRYGVELRFPWARTSATESDTPEWTAIARQTLRAAAAGANLDEVPLHPPMAEILAEMGPELAAGLLHDQPKGDAVGAVEALSALAAGRPVDADLLFRRYVLGHWLRRTFPAGPDPVRREPGDVVIGDRAWRRIPVATGLLQPGDPLVEKIAWHVAEAIRTVTEPQSWYLLLAAKPVAVVQGRVRPVWEIEPTRSARTAAYFSTRPAWLEEVAIAQSGAVRTIATALAVRLRLPGLAARMTTERMAGIRAPRSDAAGPARYCVVSAPRAGDETAEEILETLARMLGDTQRAALAGCAIVSAGDDGVRLHGFAGAGDPATAVALAKGNPFGQADSHEPLVIAVALPPRTGSRPGRKVRRRPVR